ncbi:MAG: ribonuclease P protein component [Bacteroidota bacterium]|nr:ribonuclease P protein component [Bacteroidota bacterium]
MNPKFTLKRKERLKSMKAIQQLFKEGKSFSDFPLRIIYMENGRQDGNLQAGFSVSKRHFKRAVDRNRVKRLIRESYRLQKINLAKELEKKEKKIAVFFIYTSGDLPVFEQLYEKMGNVLERIEKSVI